MTESLPTGLLRSRIAREMWDACRSKFDSVDPPPILYKMADIAIKETYTNFDKLLMETIKDRLEGLI